MNKYAKVISKDVAQWLTEVARIVVVILVIVAAMFLAGISIYLMSNALHMTPISLIQYFKSMSFISFACVMTALGTSTIIGFALFAVLLCWIFIYIIPGIFYWFPLYVFSSIRLYISSVKERASDGKRINK